MNIVKRRRKELHVSIREVSDYLEIPLLVYLYYECINIKALHTDILFDLCDYLNLDYHIL